MCNFKSLKGFYFGRFVFVLYDASGARHPGPVPQFKKITFASLFLFPECESRSPPPPKKKNQISYIWLDYSAVTLLPFRPQKKYSLWELIASFSKRRKRRRKRDSRGHDIGSFSSKERTSDEAIRD